MSQVSTLTFEQTLEHTGGLAGIARVRDLPPVALDEPVALGGEDAAPCPMDYLLTAVGGCLLSSLAFGLAKKRVAGRVSLRVSGRVERDAEGLLRVAGIEAEAAVAAPPADHARVRSAWQVFQKYCIVSASVARGIPLETRLRLLPE